HLCANGEAAEVAVGRETLADMPAYLQAAGIGAAQEQLGRAEHASSQEQLGRAYAHLTPARQPVTVGHLVAAVHSAGKEDFGDLTQLDQVRELRVGEELAPQRLVESMPRLRQAAEQAASLALAVGVCLVCFARRRLRAVWGCRRAFRVVIDD